MIQRWQSNWCSYDQKFAATKYKKIQPLFDTAGLVISVRMPAQLPYGRAEKPA
jgi:hypothetical protein